MLPGMFRILGRRQLSLSTYLVMIVAIALVPVLIFSSVIVSGFIEGKREESQKLLIKSADELALAFDQEIQATIRTLQAVSMANSLRKHDFEAFHGVMNRVLKTQTTWSNILLHGPDATWLLDAHSPFGTKLSRPPEPQSLLSVVENKKVAVGKVIKISPENYSSRETYYAFAVRVPVLSDTGEVKYVLSAIIKTDEVQKLVGRFGFATNEWVRAIVDQDGTIAGRSREPEKYTGGPASETLRKLLKGRENGLENTFSLEKIPVTTAFRRSPVSGWYSAVAVPAEVLAQQSTQITTTIIISALLLLFLSLIATILLSRWLRKSFSSTSKAAATLAAGGTPEMPQSNVREVENLRESLLEAAKLLRSRERAKSDFLANMSHELRTPLGIVVGTADLLSNNMLEGEEKDRGWESIKRNGEQLRRLIDDILDFSKVEANKLIIENIRFSLTELISSIVEDFTPAAIAKGLRLSFTKDEEVNEVVASDPVRVRQIVSNLIANSIKFTDRGEIVVKIHRAVGEFSRITISDTGIGLSESQQTALFKDFTQGDSSHTRKYGGTGLGLSLSRKIARLLQGDVTLTKSVLGEGSVFEFTFRSVQSSTHTQSAKKQTAVAKAQSLRGKRILIAEDSRDNVALMKAYLRDTGADIHVASNGVEAYKMSAANQYDVILMDIQMPEMDGYEATELIRKVDGSTPILALTAHALNEQRERAMASGFTGYLTKPVKRESLIESISGLF